MNRSNWKFEYPAKDLALACADKVGFHQARAEFWQTKKDEVMAEVKDAGIEVSESLAGQNYSTAMRGPQVMVRTDLQEKLTEAFTKIKEHTAAAKTFEGWRQVLNADPEKRFALDHEDWLYFFGK